ncbi:MAG: hypothetical protein ABI646_01910 [Acidobacteriota bacterium]
MNSEELELSLRTEFENYLKDVFAAMREDVADFQKNFEAEFEKHRSQMDEAFKGLTERFGSDVKFDKGFTESVVEHLRLARDDGAQLSANAFNEAQKFVEASAPSPSNYDQLRDAIKEISAQTTQSAILKSLVDHVANFTPRGAFFIVKNDSFVCWRRFDRARNLNDDGVREAHFPVSADTLLADAVGSLMTRDNSSASHADDSSYLNALDFGPSDRMLAVPLVARGRGVAVLYADSGSEGEQVNLEAIESLVRVAGLTVELRAAASSAQSGASEAPSYVPMHNVENVPAVAPDSEPYESSDSTGAVEERSEFVGAVAVEALGASEPETVSADIETPSADEAAYFEPVPVADQEETGRVEVESGHAAEPVDATPGETVNDFAFASSDAYDATADVEPEPVEEYAYATETPNGNGHSYEPSPEPLVEVAAAQPVKSRLSDRNVDLPIEVSDDERRLHNDARRFARLLVSEIKLYNEQKVNEGRNASDLYDRLREAIDRSREMYDKRVQPQVAAKFDYFHYELVSNLAEGNDTKLGGSYPGSTI